MWKEHHLAFYEMNLVGHGLDFTEIPDIKEDFLRYVVELECLNPVANTRKTPLPPLEDLVEGVSIMLAAGLKHGSEPRKELGHAIRASRTKLYLFPGDQHTNAQDMRLNTHLGAIGAMSKG